MLPYRLTIFTDHFIIINSNPADSEIEFPNLKKTYIPSCTLNVILFPEQGVEIRTFPPSQTLIIELVYKIFGNATKTD